MNLLSKLLKCEQPYCKYNIIASTNATSILVVMCELQQCKWNWKFKGEDCLMAMLGCKIPKCIEIS